MKMAAFSQRMPPVQKLMTVLSCQFVFVRPKGIWEFCELGQTPVNGAFEGAFVHFVSRCGCPE
jgi:hypothetical protein